MVRNVLRKRWTTSGGIAAGALDFDDIRPKVSEKLGARKAFLVGEIENADVGERAFVKRRLGQSDLRAWWGGTT